MNKKLKEYWWKEEWTSLYLMAMFVAFPLYFQNGFFNILEAKTFLFQTITCIYLSVGVVLIWLVSVFRAEEERKHGVKVKSKKKEGEKKRKYACMQIFFFLFSLSTIWATVISGNLERAWYAAECKLFGTFVILMCCGIYLAISGGYIKHKGIVISLFIGNSIVFLLAILNRYGIDVLNIWGNLLKTQRNNYISTIGNINILSNYICVFLPLFMGCFIEENTKIHKIFAGILVYLGVIAGMATNSDSFYLGFFVSLFFFLWFSMEKKNKLMSYIWMCILYSVSILSIQLFNRMSTYDYVWKKSQKFFIEEVPWLGIILSLLLLFYVVKNVKNEFHLLGIRKIIFIVIGCMTVIILFMIVWINVTGKEIEYSILVFNDSWGTNRGFVWKRTWELYKELPLVQKVTGIGPGGFAEFFAKYNVERKSMGLPNFVDPHNEILYYLISTGITGMIGYFGMIISTIINCLKRRSPQTIVLAAIFVSWLAQGTVNNPLVFTTPYLFIFLGMAQYELKNNVKTLK